MKQEEITANRERFVALCRQYIHREGLDGVLSYLDSTDFYTAPSSTLFHLNEDGGLCQHSLNVFDTAMKLHESVAKPAIANGESPFTAPLSEESIAIATLFHDVCKTKLYHKAQRWKKDENGRWQSYDGYEVKDEFPYGHGEKSCLILSWYMRLKSDELLAIRWHMGMFDMGENGSSQRYAFRAALEKTPLVCLVHAADFLSSNILEKTTAH